MKKDFAILSATAWVMTLGLAHAEGEVHWSYEGPGGPDHWAEISKEAGACAVGVEQSPIDLTHGIGADAPAVTLDWAAGAEWSVVNNGHTIQVNGTAAGKMTIDGKDYDLLQFHFHHPSEHAIDGQHSPMEVHFVHKSSDGALAVLGVMLVGGGNQGPMDAIMQAAPQAQGEAPLGALDLAAFLPDMPGFYRYAGSLTTPPCSEIVLWTVMRDPVAVSDASLSAFATLFPMNARPLQAVNRRFILSEN
jgi:carbonic anhydrase